MKIIYKIYNNIQNVKDLMELRAKKRQRQIKIAYEQNLS